MLKYEYSFRFLLTSMEEKQNMSLVSFQRNQETLEEDKVTPMTSEDNFIL